MVRYPLRALIAVVCVWGASLPVLGVREARAQVLQLPTFDYFSVQTSVLVPDRGGAYVGGVRRATYAASGAGVAGTRTMPGMGRLLGNRALAAGATAGAASVHATIIDSAALDRAVLAEAARRRTQEEVLPSRAAELSRQLLEDAPPTPSPAGMPVSLSEIRQRNAQRKRAQQGAARQFFSQAMQAEQRGQLGAAKIYYQMARRRADAELLQRIESRLSQLDTVAASRTTAGRLTP
jgi:hypothetical protein